MILLDTSVLSRAFRRKRPAPPEQRLSAALQRLIEGDADLGLPGIVLQEVLTGIRLEKQFADLERRLTTGFAIVHPTTTNHVDAARLRNTCVSKGLNVSGTDCLIATLAISGHHQLFALDDDFRAIARYSTLELLSDDGRRPGRHR